MNTMRLTGNRGRVRRYRTTHRRFDYVPSPDVLPIIEHHLKLGTDHCVAGVTPTACQQLLECGIESQESPRRVLNITFLFKQSPLV